jgi:hypothetical protein
MVSDRVSVRGGRVRRWRLGEGSTFASGDVIVDIDITVSANLARNRNRPHLGSERDREDRLNVRPRKHPYVIRVVALEGGVLRKIVAPVGAEVVVGDLLGVASAHADVIVEQVPPPGGPALQTYARPVKPRENRLLDVSGKTSTADARTPKPKSPHRSLYARAKRRVPKGIRRRARSLLRRVGVTSHHGGGRRG